MKKFSIPTKFDGTFYRSKTEAQFALLMCWLQKSFEYEPADFEVGEGIGYRPDFYLPDIDRWFEVKGEMTQEDYDKITGFQKLMDTTVFIGMIVDGQMMIMDIENNDLSNEFFGDFDPELVSKMMKSAMEYNFTDNTKPNINKDKMLKDLMIKYIWKLEKGGTFYHFSNDYSYIYNEITFKGDHSYITPTYWIKIEVDNDGWYYVSLWDDDKELFGQSTEYIEFVLKLSQQIYRTAYELYFYPDEDYDEILHRGIGKAMAVATMGHT